MTVNITLTDHQLTILDAALAFYLENEYFASKLDYCQDVKELKNKMSLERGILKTRMQSLNKAGEAWEVKI